MLEVVHCEPQAGFHRVPRCCNDSCCEFLASSAIFRTLQERQTPAKPDLRQLNVRLRHRRGACRHPRIARRSCSSACRSVHRHIRSFGRARIQDQQTSTGKATKFVCTCVTTCVALHPSATKSITCLATASYTAPFDLGCIA